MLADPKQTIDYKTLGKHAASGFFAGVVGTVFGHPLDVVKTRLQTQHHLYKGALDCFIKVAKSEGISQGLYRGIAPPLVSLTFLNTLSFSAYGEFKSLFKTLNDKLGTSIAHSFASNEGLQPWQYYAAGGLCGFSLSVVSTPFEFIKVRMQLDNITEKKYKSSLQCARQMISQHGVKILYTGYVVNNIREIAFCSVYFGFYETGKFILSNLMHGHNVDFSSPLSSPVPPLAVLFAGGISGASAWAASFPFDVIKSNIQGQSINNLGSSQTRLRMIQVIKERWSSRGIFAFYSGIGPSVTRAFIVSSTRFSAYEFMMKLLNSWDK